MADGGYPDLAALAADAAAGAVRFRIPAGGRADRARAAAARAVGRGIAAIDARRAERDAMIAAHRGPAASRGST